MIHCTYLSILIMESRSTPQFFLYRIKNKCRKLHNVQIKSKTLLQNTVSVNSSNSRIKHDFYKVTFQTCFSFKLLTNYGIYKIMFGNFIKITDLTQFHQNRPSKHFCIELRTNYGNHKSIFQKFIFSTFVLLKS